MKKKKWNQTTKCVKQNCCGLKVATFEFELLDLTKTIELQRKNSHFIKKKEEIVKTIKKKEEQWNKEKKNWTVSIGCFFFVDFNLVTDFA